MDGHTAMLYNNIFKVVHYTHHTPGDWNYWLCQRNRDGKYFVYAILSEYRLRDERISVKKYLTGFCFEEGSYDYAGSVMMDIVEKIDAYFTADNLTVEWVMEEESYDRYSVEIRDEESRVGSPDRPGGSANPTGPTGITRKNAACVISKFNKNGSAFQGRGDDLERFWDAFGRPLRDALPHVTKA